MNSSLLLQELPYHQDSTARFELLAGESWSMWLDSAGFGMPLGRYDILVSEPLQTLVTRGMQTTITGRDGSTCHTDADPFVLIRQALSPFHCDNPTGLPFIGGALGYFSYATSGSGLAFCLFGRIITGIDRMPMAHGHKNMVRVQL